MLKNRNKITGNKILFWKVEIERNLKFILNERNQKKMKRIKVEKNSN